MAYYYSASERAFFSSEFMTVGEMPSDKVAVADSAWKGFVADQSAGKIIRSTSAGAPESAAQSLTALTGFYMPGAVSVSGALDVAGATTLKSTLSVAGKTTAKAVSATDISASTVTTTGNASVGGTLTSTGAATLKSTLNVAGKSTLSAVDVTGNATVGKKNVVRSVDGVNADANGNVDLKAVSYKTLSSIQSVAGSFYFDNRSGIAASELPTNVAKADWTGIQIGTPNGNDKAQFIFNGPEVWYRSDDGNLGQETWTADSWNKILMSKDGNVSFQNITARDNWLATVLPDTTKGTLPTKNTFGQLFFRDSTSVGLDCAKNVLGAVEAGVRTDGNSDIKIYANKNVAGTDERAVIAIGWKKNGTNWTAYSTAPATYDGANNSEIVTAGWGNKQWLKCDGTGTMSGTIKSSAGGASYVAAANGATIIDSTSGDGVFAPLWRYKTYDGGSFVLSGLKNAFRLESVRNFVSMG